MAINWYPLIGKGVGITLWKIIPLFPVSPGFQHLELDMSLSCPGERDTTCGHWDHGISLFVCCNPNSSLCGMEIGRWISPFRR